MNASLKKKGNQRHGGGKEGGGGSSKLEVRSANFFLRPYQREALENHTNGIEVWLWGRQTGKSFTLAAWAVDRLLRNPGRLVTVLSNSRANGMELNLKCAEICQRLEQIFEQEDLSGDTTMGRFETMNYETRITINGRVGRIKVLPANPRTARGFSGDLILDEFAFHENSVAIWEAVEPILAANPDYLCRVASTPNGRHNMFYRLATNANIPVRKITRSEAWRQGLRIYHPISRAEITPEHARELALDKRAYEQNYACVFEDENMALLTAELITAAEREKIGFICDQDWNSEALSFLGVRRHDCAFEGATGCAPVDNPDSPVTISNPKRCHATALQSGPLYVGVDVGRTHDLTVITVMEKENQSLLVRAILRLREMRLPEQQERLGTICRFRNFRAAHVDMTGLGLGLYEYSEREFGGRIRGINFSSNLSLGASQSARAPEVLATQLLQAYEDRRIQHPIAQQLRDDLRKPERITTPTGRVSIAAACDEAGHADHFWSLALAVNAAFSGPEPYLHVVPRNGVRSDRVPTRRALRLRRIPRRHLI